MLRSRPASTPAAGGSPDNKIAQASVVNTTWSPDENYWKEDQYLCIELQYISNPDVRMLRRSG